MRVRLLIALAAGCAAALAGCSDANRATHGASLKAVAGSTPPVTPGPPVAALSPTVSWSAGPAGSDVVPQTPTTTTFEGPVTSIGHRTAGLVTLRLFTAGLGTVAACDPYHSRCVPAWCQPTSQFAVELSTQEIAAQDLTYAIGVGPGSHLSVLDYSTQGTSEGHPVVVALLRAANDVDHVTLKTPGQTDTAAPVAGLVALAAPGAFHDGTLIAYDKAGTVLQVMRVPVIRTVDSAACALQAVKLPVAGTPPADPVAAEREIRAAFHTAFTANPSGARYSSLVAVQHGDQLHHAIDQVLRNFPNAGKDITVTTGRLVFVNPTTAVLDWTPTYTGGAPYGPQVGTAVLVDGRWLVSEETYCGLLRFGAASCP